MLHNSFNVLTIDVPDVFIIDEKEAGLVKGISTIGTYLPRLRLTYDCFAHEQITRDDMAVQIARFHSPTITSDIIRYRNIVSDTRLLHGFNTTLSHPKYEALWGGDMTLLYTHVRIKAIDCTWHLYLEAELPTNEDTPVFIQHLHHTLANVTILDHASEIFLRAWEDNNPR